MIRPLVIVINLFIALWVKLLASHPSAEATAPEIAHPGEPFIVNVTLSPDGETGFMRYAMEIPAGWTVEKKETAGAAFLFEKNSSNENYSAKFLWSRVPETTELKFSFEVTPSATASGAYLLPCKISHTVDNLPENIPLRPLEIKVESASSANTQQNPDSTAKPAASISIVRTVPTEPVTGEFLVDIVIQKGDLVNFGKLQDSLPDGFLARQVMNDGASFSFENGCAKFYWPVLPKKETLHIQYKVVASPDMTGSRVISGYFSYVENETGKIARFPASTVSMKENAALVQKENQGNNQSGNQGNSGQNQQSGDNGQQASSQGNQSQNNDANQSGNSSQKNSGEQQNGNSGQNQSGNSSSQAQAQQQQQQEQNQQSGSSAGVSYSVQIAAMRRMVPAEYYTSTYHISGAVNMEQGNGLNRYTNGSFSAYQDARNHRESIRSKGVSDAFVVAYSNGKRVTVQEALMITNQKWIR